MATSIGTAWIQIKPTTTNLADTIRNDLDAAKASVAKLNSSVSNLGKNSNSIFGGMSAIGAAAFGALVKIGQDAFQEITNSIGDAVSRVDTLNNASRTFQYMGFTASDTAKMMDNLKASILGLPTSLDDAVSGVELLAAQTGNLSEAQKVYTALNDAVLGFGGTASMASNAVLQFSQDIGKGYISGSTLNSMLNANMGPAISAIAKKFGTTSGALRDALGGLGNLSDVGIPYVGNKVEWFEEQLVSLDENGGGGLASLQTIAKSSTKGIGTSFTNMQTAITRGMADIINAIGSSGIASMITGIGNAFEGALKGIAGAITFMSKNKDIFGPIAAAVAAATAAFVTLFAIIKIGTAITAMLNVVTNDNPIGIIIVAVAALVAGLAYFFTQTKLGKQIFQEFGKIIGNVFSAIGTAIGQIGKLFAGIWTVVTQVFNNIVNFLKQWGVTILAVIFLPISLSIGFFITFRTQIFAIFNAIWTFIQGIFNTIYTVIVQPVVNFIVAYIQLAIGIVTAVINTIITVVSGIFNTVAGIVGGVVGVFSGAFSGAWNAIVQFMSPVVGFFRSIWNGIVSIFTSIGTAIGDAVSGAFKSVVNGVLSFIAGIINTVISGINGVISILDAIPGVKLGKISAWNPPKMASGGWVTGAGTGTSDDIPTMLSNGEFVVKAAAAQNLGPQNMAMINRGELPNTNTTNIAAGAIVINGYNQDPEALAKIISQKIALRQKGVMA